MVGKKSARKMAKMYAEVVESVIETSCQDSKDKADYYPNSTPPWEEKGAREGCHAYSSLQLSTKY